MSEKMSFESAMNELEKLVRLLEDGDAPLDQSLAYFEKATGLIKFCQTQLDKAEQKVIMLTKKEQAQDE